MKIFLCWVNGNLESQKYTDSDAPSRAAELYMSWHDKNLLNLNIAKGITTEEINVQMIHDDGKIERVQKFIVSREIIPHYCARRIVDEH